MNRTQRLSAGLLFSALGATAGAEQLTPLGALQGANNDGSIPAWEGGYQHQPTGDTMQAATDPFASDTIEFYIDKNNYENYRALLTPGQIEMLRRNPEDYRLNIYKTRRSAALPQPIYDMAQKNARSARLSEDGNGITGFQGYYPFIQPANGLQAIWNHFMRYRGGSLLRKQTQIITQASGDYAAVGIEEEAVWPENLNDYDPVEDQNIIFMAKQKVTAPARLAGTILLVHDTINQVKQPRMAWLYNAGQRRVRRAPQVAYDGPGTASDGLRTADNVDMYSGSPDRYEWKLEGRHEIYIPYNNFKLTEQQLNAKQLIQTGHLNPAYLRYEKHRVWKVVGTLKAGQRHVYQQRVFYLDEDTWQIALAEHYDSHGSLWRFSEGFAVQYDYADTPWYAAEAIYDFNSSRYLVYGLICDADAPIKFGFKSNKSEFTPAALRISGVR